MSVAPIPSEALLRLIKLHEIDEAIRISRVQLSALDGGKAKIGVLREIKTRLDAAEAAAHTAGAEATDADLARQSSLDKADAAERELYSGRITAPREVEDRTRHVESLRKQAEETGTGLAALHATARELREAAEVIKTEFEAMRREAQVEVKRQTALSEKLGPHLQELEPRRAEVASCIEPALLKRYEEIRVRHKGVGMAKVIGGASCGVCGNAIPSRLLDSLAIEKIVTCEACHRILYWTDAV